VHGRSSSVGACVLVLVLAVALPRAAGAQQLVDIVVGSVSAPEGAGPAAVEALRQALVGAARVAVPARRGLGRSLVLTGAVTRLERARQGQRIRLEAEISVVVMERPGGQMRALLTGRATSTQRAPLSSAEAHQQERGVIDAAVREAMGRLWTSMLQACRSRGGSRGRARA
jgi:hypothetical protein